MIVEAARQRLDLAPLRRGLKSQAWESLPPAVVRQPGRGWVLLAGERRWVVRRELGMYDVHSIQSWADLLAWMILDRGEQQQAGEVFSVLPHDDVSAAYATNRILGNLRAGRDDFGPRTTAEYLGRDYQTVSTVRTVLKYLTSDLPEIRELTGEVLVDIRRGDLTASGGHGRIKNLDTKLRQPRTGPAQQRKVMDNLISVVDSITHELDSMGQLSDQHGPEDCQRWLEALMRLNEKGYQMRRALRERINGSSGTGLPAGQSSEANRG